MTGPVHGRIPKEAIFAQSAPDLAFRVVVHEVHTKFVSCVLVDPTKLQFVTTQITQAHLGELLVTTDPSHSNLPEPRIGNLPVANFEEEILGCLVYHAYGRLCCNACAGTA